MEPKGCFDLCLVPTAEESLGRPDLARFVRDIQVIAADYGLAINQVVLRTDALELSTSDPRVLARVIAADT